MKFKHVLVAVVIVPLALTAVGCNSGKSSSGSGSTTTAASGGSKDTPTTAAPAAATGLSMGSAPTGSTKDLNIAQIAAGTPATQTLTRLVLLAGLLPTVRDGGPFTVFAPTDDAFGKVDPATLQAVASDNKKLTTVLTLHVVPGTLTTDDLKQAAATGTSLTTAEGGKLKVEVKGEDIYVGGAKIIIPDIPAKNGQVHAVDSVITAANG